ncbi:MAG: IS1634 family transposase [Firmicutes bacterium]|nr:IS1634 family transposase [Bacillota bacterium]
MDRLVQHLAQFTPRLQVIEALTAIAADAGRAWGLVLVARALWERLGVGPHLRQLVQRAGHSVPLDEAIFAMVVNRLADPHSKRGMLAWLPTVWEPRWAELELHHLYRGLDLLAEVGPELERVLFDGYRDLFHLELDLVFFDTTSSYFVGHPQTPLAQRGYSKDHRPDRQQLLLGLLMTRDGLPVGHWVFPGATVDHQAMAHALADLKQRWPITRLIVVGDRGMLAPHLLEWLDAARWEYILGQPLRRRRVVDPVLRRRGRYHWLRHSDGSRALGVKEAPGPGGTRLILVYNPERAAEDAALRDALRAQLARAIDQGSVRPLLKGYRRYVITEGTTIRIHEQAFRGEARYDGKFVLRTNTSLPAAEVVAAYKQAWQIERAFRTLKSHLDLRPMFHWTDARIRGHITVCVLALVLEYTLQRLLRDAGCTTSTRTVLTDLEQVQAVPLTVNNQAYLCRTPLVGTAATAFRVAGVAVPPTIALRPH